MFVKHLFCIYLIWFVKRKILLAFDSFEKGMKSFGKLEHMVLVVWNVRGLQYGTMDYVDTMVGSHHLVFAMV